jgi:malyl-CoA/(S)-citramalyl-CoA lyase
MSACQTQTKPQRLQRSELAVPATSEKYFAKAAACAADQVFIELEDAVAPNEKVRARGLAIRAINDIDWGNKTVAVRVNGLDTEWGYRDIVDVAEQCPRLDLVLLPKASSAADIQCVDLILSGIERATRRTKRIGIEALIESAAGIVNAPEIAAASPRMEALIFGVWDYMIDLQADDLRMNSVGQPAGSAGTPSSTFADEQWRADQWNYAQSRIVTVCRANGLRPIDGPYTNFGNPEGYLVAARRARALGFEGKWAIHPSQVDLANEVFAPNDAQVKWAENVVSAMDAAIAEGKGAVKVNNELFDLAHLKLAKRYLERAALARSSSAR